MFLGVYKEIFSCAENMPTQSRVSRVRSKLGAILPRPRGASFIRSIGLGLLVRFFFFS